MFARRAWHISVLLQEEISRYFCWPGSQTSMSHLQTIAREITLSDLPEAFATLLKGAARGRYVVTIR